LHPDHRKTEWSIPVVKRYPGARREVPKRKRVTKDTYRALAEFRHQILRYMSFGDGAARAAGVEPRQYQLLLAVRGLPRGTNPTVGALAEQLQIRHHSAVELIIRAERQGLVRRRRSSENASYVLVSLTRKGDSILQKVVTTRLQELQTAGPLLVNALRKLMNRKRPKA